MQFTAPPVRILTDAETLAMADPTTGAAFLASPDRYRTKSPMICAFMDELEKNGFVYNAPALRAFEAAHGLPKHSENGSAFSVLVYTSQAYRAHDKLVRDGWTPGSPEMMQEAFDRGMGIMVCGSNMLGGNVEEVFKVRSIGSKLYVMRPHKKKYAIAIGGMPCKIVPLPKKAPRAKALQPA